VDKKTIMAALAVGSFVFGFLLSGCRYGAWSVIHITGRAVHTMQTAPPDAGDEMPDPVQTYTLLVIDDNRDYLFIIEEFLRMEGFRVCKASSGATALVLLRDKVPDLILCDIMMPEMDGHTLFELLKQDELLAAVPFIFVTALGGRDDVRKGMAAGVDDYLTKPFSKEELVSAVCGRLKRVKALRCDVSQTSRDKEAEWLRNLITKREIEVLLLVGTGATSKQIAEHFCISIRTVENHRTHLMNKLNVTNAAALAHWAQVAKQL
jgi:DNA-binding NarL/FixJ family response regulator